MAIESCWLPYRLQIVGKPPNAGEVIATWVNTPSLGREDDGLPATSAEVLIRTDSKSDLIRSKHAFRHWYVGAYPDS